MRCADCNIDVGKLQETCYMLRDSLWESLSDEYLLCIGCVEVRLGRRLDRHDFDCLTANLRREHHSPRLRSRLRGFARRYGTAAKRAFNEIKKC